MSYRDYEAFTFIGHKPKADGSGEYEEDHSTVVIRAKTFNEALERFSKPSTLGIFLSRVTRGADR